MKPDNQSEDGLPIDQESEIMHSEKNQDISKDN